LQKRCMICGRFFTPDRRVGERQKVCSRGECKKERKKRAQENWVRNNPDCFKNHYSDYVKPWRQKKRQARLLPAVKKDGIRDKSPEVIKDKIPISKSYQQLILLIPVDKAGMIQDEIRLRKVAGYTFAAYG
jgi:hypothetical protein